MIRGTGRERSPWATLLAWSIAVVAGLLGFGIHFSDAPSGNGANGRFLAAAAVAAVAGALAGFLRPSHRLALGLVAGWGALVAGVGAWAAGRPGWVPLLGVPLAAGLLGACAGARIRRQREIAR